MGKTKKQTWQKKHLNLQSLWYISIAVIIVAGSILFSLEKEPKEVKIFSRKAMYRAADVFDLSKMPALVSDENLYNKNNEIVVASGIVEITHANGRQKEVVGKSIVDIGDQISVSNDGSAEIFWFDGSITRLAAGTEMKVVNASYDKENISKTKIHLLAKRGKIWAKIVNLIDGESEFIIESTAAIAGVRGTTFNYILEEGIPTVEVIEHIAFIAKLDEYDTKKLVELTSGQTGTLNRSGEIELKTFDQSRLKEPYYTQNLKKDTLADIKLKESNLKKIKELAGPLPGEPNYLEKQQLIKELLEKTKDPIELDELEARVIKMKIYEAISLSDTEALQKALKELENKNEKVRNNVKNNLKNIERVLGPINREDGNLYDIKRTIQTEHVQMETDPQKQKEALKKVDLRENFEIPARPTKSPSVIITEPKQLKKVTGKQEIMTPKKESVSPQTYYKRTPTPDPKEKHKEVFEKIKISREKWTQRVEKRLQQEQELLLEQDDTGVETTEEAEKRKIEGSRDRKRKESIEEEPADTIDEDQKGKGDKKKPSTPPKSDKENPSTPPKSDKEKPSTPPGQNKKSDKQNFQ